MKTAIVSFVVSLTVIVCTLAGLSIEESLQSEARVTVATESLDLNVDPVDFSSGPTDEVSSEWSDENESVTSEQSLPGLVVPVRRAPVRAAVSGVVSELRVDTGDMTAASQAVAVVDDTEITSRIAAHSERIAATQNLVVQAKAQVNYARQTYGMFRNLNKQLAASTAKLIESRYRLEVAIARVEEVDHQVAQLKYELVAMKEQRSKHKVVAPIAGTVTDVLRFVDQYVAEGDVLFWLDGHELELKVHIPSNMIVSRDQVRFSIFVNKAWHELNVARWQSRINADGSRTLLLQLPSDLGLLPGQVVNAHIQREDPTR